jgi:N-acetylglutamate synthase-like GNAT family acetyltransferase
LLLIKCLSLLAGNNILFVSLISIRLKETEIPPHLLQEKSSLYTHKMIRKCTSGDFKVIYNIINDAARAYEGVIPADRWKYPYMPEDELKHEIDDGVIFWGYEEEGGLIGVMGIQELKDVTLIRHAYVKTSRRNQGIGSLLLQSLLDKTVKPVLIGTWADAHWALRFYEKHGFRLVSNDEKNTLLKRYWKIPERQVETSVVLVDVRYKTG